VYLRHGTIYAIRDGRETPILPLAELAFTLDGAADCMVENALAAVGATWALGIPASTIAEGLSSFRGGALANPGRMNLYHVGGVDVLIDYGHNPAALEAVLRATRRLSARRLLAVVGMPGDRRDEDAIAFGAIAGRGFDRVFVKEDRDRRGRPPGVMADLIARGARSAGRALVEVELDEPTALRRALLAAEPGDLVVVLYERLEPLLGVLAEAKRSERQVLVGAGLG
jgi:cyanophycin synthetase